MGSYTMDKSVFFRTQQRFGYGYEWGGGGGGFRDPNQTNLGNGILKVNANFETGAVWWGGG